MAGLVVNIDINSHVTPFLTTVSELPNPKKEDLYPFIDQYALTQVTDIALCVFCQYSATPSKAFSDALFKLAQKEENGIPVDYSDRYKGICALYGRGIDPYEVWFKRCTEKGINSWLSIRMNDCHEPDDDTCFLRSEFFYEARKNGWMIGKKYGYFRNCLDYSFPTVREKMLGYIEEQLERYDVYGLELDFQRELFCFPYLDGRFERIMNGFMRKVRAVADKIGEKRGRKIRVMARLNRDISHNLIFGFDAETWIYEGLVDIIAVCPRWASNDNAMPIDAWKRLVRGSGVKIYAGLEILLNVSLSRASITPEIAKGLSSTYLNMGADGIYLFNLFRNPFNPWEAAEIIWNTCGSLDTAIAGKRRHAVTPQDISPEGSAPYAPLPLEISAGEKAVLLIPIAPADASRALAVKLGIYGKQPPRVSINGLECSDPVISDCEYNNGELTFYDYAVPRAEFPIDELLEITNYGDKAVSVCYAEISVL